jgi:hypothetical protein
LAFLLQPAKESVETLLQKLLSEGRVGASARQVGFGQRRKGAHEHDSGAGPFNHAGVS